MELWCEYAWLGGDDVAAGVMIAIEDGAITTVQPGAARPPAAESLPGVTLPGFANAHSHAFQRRLRARTQRERGSFWTWREAMYAAAATLTPDDYFTLARATFAEMALAGITLAGEFHYLHHTPGGESYDDPNAMGRAVAAAAADAGIRLTLLDTCYLHGGSGRVLEGAQRRFGDRDVAAWAERVEALAEAPLLRIGAAAHSVRALEPDELAAVAGWAQDRSAPLHAHVSEQRRENEECLARHGRTPTALLAEAGCVDERFTAVHATHLSADDVRLLGDAHATCCFCPTTERDLADGIGRARPLTDAGAPLALGTDSNALIDMFEEARAAELDERLASEQRVNSEPAELLNAATANGYRALGWTGGSLQAGSAADLLNVDIESVRLAGTPADTLVPAIVFAADPADVRHVMVDGRWIVRDGAHVSLDVAAELERALR